MTDIEASPLSGTYADAALTYLANGFNPIPVQSKFPPVSGATGKEGTVTPAKVELWRSDPTWADQNIALRATGFIGIDVDSYGSKHGETQLAELEEALGELPVTISSTARGIGPSRTYYYIVPDDLEFLSKASPDIDIIQKGHRYALVAPSVHPSGQFYEWYGEDDELLSDYPSIDQFENLPTSWLEFLTVDPAAKREGFTGSIEEWLDNCQVGEPSGKVRGWINNIPEENFSHVDVVRVTYALIRLGAEREPGIRQALETLYFTWLRGEFDQPRYEKELNVAIQGAIRKAGQFGPTPETLPRYFDAAAFLPSNMSKSLDHLVYKASVEEIPSLVAALYEHLESERDIASIVWQRASSLGMDFTTVWQMVLDGKASTEVAKESKPDKTKYSLLTKGEREKVSESTNWMTKYIDYARTSVAEEHLNMPYHKAAGWVAASMIYGPYGKLRNGPKPLGLNVWFNIVGESSTGKNIAMNALDALLLAFFGDESTYNIAASGSMVGFQEILLERDKKATLMMEDEISGIFAQWMDPRNPAFNGMPDKLTSWYEGSVTSMPRRGRPDLAGGSKTHLCTYFMGTPARMFSVLTKDHFATGFLARSLWAVGQPSSEVVEYSLPKNDGQELDNEGNSVAIKQWGEQLRAEVNSIGSTAIMEFSTSASNRMMIAGTKIINLFRKHPDSEALYPSAKRMNDSIRKCAALLALADGRKIVEQDDVLYVLAEAEQWLENVENVVAQISSTPHRQKMDRVLRYIASVKSPEVREGKISELLGEEMSKVKQVLESLIIERKISKKEEGPNTFYRLEKYND